MVKKRLVIGYAASGNPSSRPDKILMDDGDNLIVFIRTPLYFI